MECKQEIDCSDDKTLFEYQNFRKFKTFMNEVEVNGSRNKFHFLLDPPLIKSGELLVYMKEVFYILHLIENF